MEGQMEGPTLGSCISKVFMDNSRILVGDKSFRSIGIEKIGKFVL